MKKALVDLCAIQLITAGKGGAQYQKAKEKVNSVFRQFKGKISVKDVDITKDPFVLGRFDVMTAQSLSVNNLAENGKRN